MSTKMSADAKKDEFRKYLEKAGVLELLTKSLVSLYEEPEKPPSALDYLKASVGGGGDKDVIAELRKEGEKLRARLLEVEGENKLLQEQVKRLETKKLTEEEPMEDAVSVPVEASNPLESAAEASEEKVEAEPAPAAGQKEAASENATNVSAEASSEATPAAYEAAPPTDVPSVAEVPAESTPEVTPADSAPTACEDAAAETPAAADTPEDSAMETEAAPSDATAAAAETEDS